MRHNLPPLGHQFYTAIPSRLPASSALRSYKPCFTAVGAAWQLLRCSALKKTVLGKCDRMAVLASCWSTTATTAAPNLLAAQSRQGALYVHRLLRNPGNQPERQLGNDRAGISLSCHALPSRQQGNRRSIPFQRNRGGS